MHMSIASLQENLSQITGFHGMQNWEINKPTCEQVYLRKILEVRCYPTTGKREMRCFMITTIE